MTHIIKSKKINNQKIFPFWNEDIKDLPLTKKHTVITSAPFLNIACCASLGKGKSTTALSLIIDNFMNKNCKLVIFSPSLKNDPKNINAIKYIREKYNKKKKNKKRRYNSDKEEDEIESEEEPDHVTEYNHFINPSTKDNNFLEEKHEAKKEFKLGYTGQYTYPKTIFYFDDLSKNEFKSDEIGTFAQNIRHHGSIAIYASQDWLNFEPRIRKNLGAVLLWGGISEERLKKIFDEIQPACKYTEFEDMYRYATKDDKCFFFIDLYGKNFRKNINEELYIEDI